MLLFLFSLLAISNACVDSVQTCVTLAGYGYCETNQLVREKCGKSCDSCTPSPVAPFGTSPPTPKPTTPKVEIGKNPTGDGTKNEDGCYGTNQDCQDEVLTCSNEFNVDGIPMSFQNLKHCIYHKVARREATFCCGTYVSVGQQLDPEFLQFKETQSLTLLPTTQPVVNPGSTPAPVGNPDDCRKTRNSVECLENGSCQWDYWTRICRAIKFDTDSCFNDNRDCKEELNGCIDSERKAGRQPDVRNLEPCVLMNPKSDCCKLYTDKTLTLLGPKRDNRPDRFDMANCEHYTRNNACKNQEHCKWDRERKICEPMAGIEAPGLWYVPEMACGYKSFKLIFADKKLEATKRNVVTSCECAVFCDDYEHWVFRQSSKKCGCTNQPVKKVARNKKGYWGSSTKKANKRDIN